MSPVGAISATPGACAPPVAASLSTDDAALPAPGCFSTDDLTRVLLLMEGSKAQGAVHAAKADIEANANLQANARQAMKQAQQEARQKESDGSFWDQVSSTFSDVAMIAGVAAAAVSVVCSGGMSAPVVLAIAGAVLSASASAAEKAGMDSDLCTGLRIGGAALSIAGGVSAAGAAASASQASGAAAAAQQSETASNVGRGLRVVEGSARIGQGGSHMVAGQYHGRAAELDADAMAKNHLVSRFDDAQAEQIERLKEIAKDAAAAMSILVDMQLSAQASAMSVIGNIGRRA